MAWFPRLADGGVATVLRRALVAIAGGGLVLGSAAWLVEQTDLASWIWGGATLLVLSALLLEIVDCAASVSTTFVDWLHGDGGILL